MNQRSFVFFLQKNVYTCMQLAKQYTDLESSENYVLYLRSLRKKTKQESQFFFLTPKIYKCYECKKIFFHDLLQTKCMFHHIKNEITVDDVNSPKMWLTIRRRRKLQYIYITNMYVFRKYTYASLAQKSPTSAFILKHTYSGVISTTSPSKQFSSDSIILFQRSIHFSKQRPGSPFLLCLITAAFCFIASSNLRPFNGFINFGNNQKSHGARSRLYWGCRMPCFITNS